MSYKYKNVVIKPGLYLGDQGGDVGGTSPIYSSMQLSLDGTDDLSRKDDSFLILPGYKAILYKNTDISYITVYTIDNTTGTDMQRYLNSTYNPLLPNQISKVDLFYNNVKINYSNIKPIGFKAAARLCWGAKLGQYSDGKYNKYALVLESSTPRLSSGFLNETSGIIGYNRPYLSLPWMQPIVTTKASHSFWWCSKGYENGALINYTLSLYPSATGFSNATIFNLLNTTQTSFTEIFFHSPTTGNLSFFIQNSTAAGQHGAFVSTKNICDGLWHHIVWNIDGTTWTIYTDGVAETATGKVYYNMPIIINGGSQIGARIFAANDTSTNGYIADYRFHKNTLTTTDIAGLLGGDHTYQTSLDGTGSCMFQYTFDPNKVYTNNYTTYAIGAATVPYAAELRNGADIMLASMDLSESLGKNIKIRPFTIGSNGFSISFWWKSDGKWENQGASSHLFYLGNGDETDNINFSLSLLDNGPSISVNTSRVYLSATALSNFCDDTWKHVVWTMAPDSTWKVYINNSLSNTYTGMAYPNVIQRSVNTIGGGYLTTDGYPCGYIGDFRIYNSTLSSTNVTSLYNQTNTSDNEMNLTQHYDFVEDTMNANNNILYSNAPRYALELTNTVSTPTGQGQYGSMPSGLAATGTNGLSISFWWKAKGGYAAQGTWSRIFDIADNVNGDNCIMFACKYSSNAYPSLEMNRGNNNVNRTSVYLSSLTDFCDGDWKHVVWTMTNSTTQTSTWNLYVNNNRYGLGNLTTTGWYPNDAARVNCFIGRSWAAVDGYQNGYITDFRVYKEVLTFDEITNLYNKVSTYTTNLLLQTLTPTTTPPTISDKLLDLINTKSPWGIYFADSYTNNTLYEARNNGRNASTTGITKDYASGNGAASNIPYINGTTTSTITWPTGSIPTTFTICSITRYTSTNSANNGRILVNSNADQTNVNFLHGHWSNKRGVAHYNAWKTTETSAGTITDWLVMCGTNGTNSTPGNILRDGTAIGTSNGGTGNAQLTVNYYEASNFALSTVFIWDQALTNAEMVIVSNALTYHLSSGIPINLGGAKIPTSITQKIPYNSLYLDGTAIKCAQASLTADLITNAGVSFAFWFKPTGAHGSWARIFDFTNTNTEDNIIFARNGNTNYPAVQVYKAGVSQTAFITNESDFFSNQVWKHAVWTMTYSSSNTSTWNVYINGKQYGSTTLTTTGTYPISIARTNCFIGKSNFPTDGLTNGQIADFRVYNTVLTQANVTALYNGIYTDNTSLFLQYPIDAAGTTNPNTIAFTLQSQAKIQLPTILLASNPTLKYNKGSYLSLPPLANTGTNGVSFSIWWRAGASYSNQGIWSRLFSFSNGKRMARIEFILKSGSESYPSFVVHNGSNYIDYYINTLTTLCDGTWKHIVLTISYCQPHQKTSTFTVYVNGTPTVLTTSGDYPQDVSRKYAYIGKSPWILDAYPTGDVADFRVYKAFLSQSNVNSLYALSDTTDKEDYLMLRRKFDSTESYLYQSCDNIKPSVLMKNDPAIANGKTGQHVVLPSLPGLISTDGSDRRGMSFSFWWKAKSLSGISGRLFEFGFAENNDILFLKMRDGFNSPYVVPAFYYGVDADVYNPLTNADGDIANLENGEWHHIVWTLSFEGNDKKSYWKFYMDGYYIKTTGLLSVAYPDYSNNPRYLNNFIGRSSWGNDYPSLNGYMSDFRIYNKCLTTQDIGHLYTNTYDDNSNLFLRYSFEKKIKIENFFHYGIYNYVNLDEQIASTNKTISVIFSQNGLTQTSLTDHPMGLTTALDTGANGGHCKLSSLTNGNDGMSFAFWFKPTGTSGTSARIFDFANGEASDNIFFCRNVNVNNAARVVLYRGNVNTDDIVISTPTDFFTNGTGWKHVVWTLSFCSATATASTWFVYINGTQYQGAGTGGAVKTTCRYPGIGPRIVNYIGKSNWNDNNPLCGMVTDFRIYNRVLSSTEATALYNNNPVSTADLYFSTNFALNVPQNYTPSHSTDSTQLGRLYNGATLSKDVYKFGTSSLFLSNFSTTNNPQYTSGIGYGQYMSTIAPLPKLGTNGISISFWWKSAGTQATPSVVFSFSENLYNDIVLFIGSSPGLQVINKTGTVYSHGFTQTNFLDGNWHHIVMNFAKYIDTWEIFYDNVSSGTLTGKYYPDNVSRPQCFFGRSIMAGQYYANGYIDEFRIHSITLSAENVDSLYNNNDSSAVDNYLVLYYSFNQDASKTEMDEIYLDNNILDTPIFNT